MMYFSFITCYKCDVSLLCLQYIDEPYIQFQALPLVQELCVERDVTCFTLSSRNYEHIVKTHQNTPVHGQNQVSDEMKFQVVGYLPLHFLSCSFH